MRIWFGAPVGDPRDDVEWKSVPHGGLFGQVTMSLTKDLLTSLLTSLKKNWPFRFGD